MDYSSSGSFVHGISQARILKWVAISFSRESSLSWDQTWDSYLHRFFTAEPPKNVIEGWFFSFPLVNAFYTLLTLSFILFSRNMENICSIANRLKTKFCFTSIKLLNSNHRKSKFCFRVVTWLNSNPGNLKKWQNKLPEFLEPSLGFKILQFLLLHYEI